VSHNLSLLSSVQRREIELKRQAALLIYKLKKGSINRLDVNKAINATQKTEQEAFRRFINYYKTKR